LHPDHPTEKTKIVNTRTYHNNVNPDYSNIGIVPKQYMLHKAQSPSMQNFSVGGAPNSIKCAYCREGRNEKSSSHFKSLHCQTGQSASATVY